MIWSSSDFYADYTTSMDQVIYVIVGSVLSSGPLILKDWITERRKRRDRQRKEKERLYRWLCKPACGMLNTLVRHCLYPELRTKEIGIRIEERYLELECKLVMLADLQVLQAFRKFGRGVLDSIAGLKDPNVQESREHLAALCEMINHSLTLTASGRTPLPADPAHKKPTDG